MAIRKRKSRAKLSTRKRTNVNTKGKIIRKLKMARRAEKAAIKKIGNLIRQHQSTIEKMRKKQKVALALKVKQAAQQRQQVVKKYTALIKKLRREHAKALKKVKSASKTFQVKGGTKRRFKARRQGNKLVKKASSTKRRRLSASRSFGTRKRARIRRAA